MTRIFPKSDWIVTIFDEEFSEFIRNWCHMDLKRMQWRIKNSLCSMDKICNDNDFVDDIQIGGLIDTTSDSK